MSRVKELENILKQLNEEGGININEWMMYMLTDVAYSLARIVDVLEGVEEKE